ncbi:hypothetical protein KJ586_03170 [Patescibacteria group bacterium]|nr:hypothetical protein [Patescibacteria group bacterium]MBU4347057.1 hypothetical protein [Patescibacteria group bacterium]MBU4455485.1 hypothetical protein [Patescibacteria group bacterium]
MSKEETPSLKLIRTLSKEDKEKFYKFQTEAVRKDLKKSQHWKDTALERAGHMVVW